MKLAFALPLLLGLSQAVQISVSGSNANASSPYQYGIMFEGKSIDGGLYAELIRNRAFYHSEQYPATLSPFESVGGAALSLINASTPLSAALNTNMRVSVTKKSAAQVGFANPGWWGIPVEKQDYKGSFWVKGAYSGSFTAALVSNITNQTYASTQVQSASQPGQWTQHNFTLSPSQAAPNVNNTLTITFNAAAATNGYLDFNLISLFPPTYKNRENGNRIDLMQALADIKPKFLRFPGGSDLEGTANGTYWDWRRAIGPLRDRPGRPDIWGYQISNGLGLIEYFNWCDDLGMEPILAVFDGLYLSGVVLSESELAYYVQDTMDELEYIMGDTSTQYGALRASHGYPKPFKVRFVEVGNEDSLDPNGLTSYYAYRFKAYQTAINAKYPDISVMTSYSNNTINRDVPVAQSADYHQYSTPDAFVLTQANFFDQNPVDSRTLIGEVATVYPNTNSLGYVNWTDRGPASFPVHPWWIGSVAEAVFLLGAERNSEKIIGAAYAPTAQNMNDWQWSPTLISFDADPAHTTRSTSHHIIKLLSNHKLTHTLPSTATNATVTHGTHNSTFNPLFHVTGIGGGASAIYNPKNNNGNNNDYVFKAAVYNTTTPVPVTLNFPGVQAGDRAQLIVLTSPQGPNAMNEVGGGNMVKRTAGMISAGAGGAFEFELAEWSVAVLRTVNVTARGFVDV